MRHRLIAVAAIAVLALLGATLLIPAGEDEDPSSPSIAPLAQAAERTAKYPGARMTFRGELEVPGSGALVSMQGKGSFNGQTGLSRATVTAESQAAAPTADEESFEMEQVAEQSAGTFVMYMRSEAFGALPDDAEWMMVDLSESTAPAPSLDPRDQLKVLRSSEDFEDLGIEQVRGVETTHYRATVDQEAEVERLREEGEDEAADALETVIEANDGETTSEVEVWVDEKSTIHRMFMEIPYSIGTIPSESTMRITTELFDFGIKPEITVPDEDDVFDATELAQEQLEQEAD